MSFSLNIYISTFCVIITIRYKPQVHNSLAFICACIEWPVIVLGAITSYPHLNSDIVWRQLNFDFWDDICISCFVTFYMNIDRQIMHQFLVECCCCWVFFQHSINVHYLIYYYMENDSTFSLLHGHLNKTRSLTAFWLWSQCLNFNVRVHERLIVSFRIFQFWPWACGEQMFLQGCEDISARFHNIGNIKIFLSPKSVFFPCYLCARLQKFWHFHNESLWQLHKVTT